MDDRPQWSDYPLSGLLARIGGLLIVGAIDCSLGSVWAVYLSTDSFYDSGSFYPILFTSFVCFQTVLMLMLLRSDLSSFYGALEFAT